MSDKFVIPIIRGYEIKEVLGQGGMGRVYSATRTSDGRQVAIKIILPSFTGSMGRQFHQRFSREIDVCKRFKHPNVVNILDGGIVEESGEPFFVMEHLTGQALDERSDFGELSEELALSIIEQITEAFAYYHPEGLVHRDIKPSNLFVVEDGRVVLLDFGLVFDSSSTRLTETGEAPGTALTMAPEQWVGAELTGATDMWQLAVTLYIALTDEMPYIPRDVMQLALGASVKKHQKLRDLRPDLSEKLESFIERCLLPTPEDRFPNAKSMRRFWDDDYQEEEDEEAGVETVEISRPTLPSHSSKAAPSPRRLLLPLAALLFSVLLLSLAVFKKYSAPKAVAKGATARDLNEDINHLTSSLLSEKAVPGDEDTRVLGELLHLAGRHASEKISYEARGLFYLTQKARGVRAFDYAKAYCKRYGFPTDETLGLALLKVMTQSAVSTEKTKEFSALCDHILKTVDRGEPRMNISFFLGRHLVQDYLRRVPKNLADREITGHAVLVEMVDPSLNKGCELLALCLRNKWTGAVRHKLLLWYFESLHALRVHRRQEEGMALFEKLVDELCDREAFAPVFQIAASLTILRMRDFSLLGRHRAAERAIPTLKKLVSMYEKRHWKALFRTYLLWALMRAQKKEEAQKLVEELAPEQLSQKHRWRYYWTVAEFYKERGEEEKAIDLFKKGAQVAQQLTVRKYMQRRPHDIWAERFRSGE